MVTTCGIFLLNKNNQILLVHPSNDPKNIWSIPKGMMETGETYIETALRETFEETNIKLDINSSKILKIFEFDMIKYKKTKKQLKSFLIISDDDFSNETLDCTSTFLNRNGENVPENNLVKWFPVGFQTHPNFSSIRLHDSQENVLNLLLKMII